MDDVERSELTAGVDWTALAIAEARAAEAIHDSPWFDDTLAAEFIAAAPRSPLGEWQRSYSQETDERWREWTFAYVQIRTRFFDEHLLEAVSAGCRQVVLLAAGLDARAFRLPWPHGTELFEVDLPQMLDFKETVLTARRATPRCQRTTVPADLRGDWGGALAAAGHRPHRPTAWLAEGLQPYLPDDAYERVLEGLESLTAPGSRLALDHYDRSRRQGMLEALRCSGPTDGVMAAWQSQGGQDPVAALANHGWEAQTYSPSERARTYGRPLGSDVEAADDATGYIRLISARWRDA